MVTKEVLSQYCDLQEEVKEVRLKIERLEKDISKIEAGEMVIDSVSGGNGGKQHFKIEGIPFPEYSRKKTLLYARKPHCSCLKMICWKKPMRLKNLLQALTIVE